MPSTSTSTWSDSAPRRNSVVSLPSPPWLVIEMPARPRSRSGSERAWLRRISSESITSTGVSTSLTVTAVRLAVTTTSSSSVAWRAPCANTAVGRARALAQAAARVRRRIGIVVSIARRAVPGSPRYMRASRGRCRGCVADAWSAKASPPRCPPHRNLWRVVRPCLQAGLRTREWRKPPDPGAFPCVRTVAVAGIELAYRCGGSAGMAARERGASPASRFNPWADAAGSPESARSLRDRPPAAQTPQVSRDRRARRAATASPSSPRPSAWW